MLLSRSQLVLNSHRIYTCFIQWLRKSIHTSFYQVIVINRKTDKSSGLKKTVLLLKPWLSFSCEFKVRRPIDRLSQDILSKSKWLCLWCLGRYGCHIKVSTLAVIEKILILNSQISKVVINNYQNFSRIWCLPNFDRWYRIGFTSIIKLRILSIGRPEQWFLVTLGTYNDLYFCLIFTTLLTISIKFEYVINASWH